MPTTSKMEDNVPRLTTACFLSFHVMGVDLLRQLHGEHKDSESTCDNLKPNFVAFAAFLKQRCMPMLVQAMLRSGELGLVTLGRQFIAERNIGLVRRDWYRPLAYELGHQCYMYEYGRRTLGHKSSQSGGSVNAL